MAVDTRAGNDNVLVDSSIVGTEPRASLNIITAVLASKWINYTLKITNCSFLHLSDLKMILMIKYDYLKLDISWLIEMILITEWKMKDMI